MTKDSSDVPGQKHNEMHDIGTGVAKGPPPEKSLKERLKVDPKLFSVKLLVFLVYGGSAAMHPFVTIHMKSLGISVTEIAIIMLLVPILSSIGPTLTGALADKLGNYKTVLISFTFISIIFHACMWFGVPPYGIHKTAIIFSSNQTGTLNIPCDGSPFSFHNSTTTLKFQEYFLDKSYGQFSLGNCSLKCTDTETQAELGILVCPAYHNKTSSHCLAFPAEIEPLQSSAGNASEFLETIAALGGTETFDRVQCLGESTSHGTNLTLLSCVVECRINLAPNVTNLSVSGNFGDRLTTIILYLIFRFLSLTAFRGINPTLDAAVLEYSKQHKADFGIQRLYASVGSVVVPPFSGWLTMVASKNCDCSDFGPAFYLFAGMNILAAMLMAKMDIRVKQPQTHIFRTMAIVLRNPNVVAFLIVVFFTGAGWGIILSYMFLFMEDDRDFQFSAPTWMLGLVNTVGYALGIPFLFFSTQLIKIFGHENLLGIGVLCYAVRFLAYSFTYNPWLIYPTEMLTAVTFLVFVLAPQYAMKTAPKYLATLVGLFGTANFGLGGGIGPLIGGLLIQWLGYRPAFRVLAIGLGIVGIVYLLVHHFLLKNRQTKENAETSGHVPEMRPLAAVDAGILSGSSVAIAVGPMEDSDPPQTAEETSPLAEKQEILAC